VIATTLLLELSGLPDELSRPLDGPQSLPGSFENASSWGKKSLADAAYQQFIRDGRCFT